MLQWDDQHIDGVIIGIHRRLNTEWDNFFLTYQADVMMSDQTGQQNGTILTDSEFVDVLHYTLSRMNLGSVHEDDRTYSRERFMEWAELHELRTAVQYMISIDTKCLYGTVVYLEERSRGIQTLESDFHELGPETKRLYMSRYGPIPTRSRMRLEGSTGRSMISSILQETHLDVIQASMNFMITYQIPVTLYRLSVPIVLYIVSYERTATTLLVRGRLPSENEDMVFHLSHELEEDTQVLIGPSEMIDFRNVLQVQLRDEVVRMPGEILNMVNAYIPPNP
jgi:hypothetical protein